MPESGGDQALLAALADIQRRGAIGRVPLSEAVAHADHFATAIPPGRWRVADLGSGGGLPGLVIAVRRPDLELTLVERRRTRADLLQRAVLALALDARVQVWADDVRELAVARPRGFEVVTARSFAAPLVTARWAAVLLAAGGLLLVSEPPDPASGRWPADELAAHGLVEIGLLAGVRRFRRGPLAESSAMFHVEP